LKIIQGHEQLQLTKAYDFYLVICKAIFLSYTIFELLNCYLNNLEQPSNEKDVTNAHQTNIQVQ